jgi:vacuolar-type H+-ATPase subunit F/Vma7
MEMVMVGDKYLTGGFRLIGMEAIEVVDIDSAVEKVEELVYGEKCRIIVITEKVAAKLKALRQNLLKTRRFYPVFVVIPDFEGPLNERTKELHQLVNQSIGTKLKIGDQDVH